MDISHQEAGNILSRYRQDPVGFLVDILDVRRDHLWERMVEVCESVRDNKNTAIKAGHGVSKSYTMARLVLWFLYCHPPATVVTTAPSHMQVEEVLWREIRLAHGNAKVPLGGDLMKTKLELGEKWFALGFATKPDTVTQQATRFQGLHNSHNLVVFDEAAGIMPEIWTAKDGLLTAGHCRFVAIGNPTSARGDFVECFKVSSYNHITISIEDTPNYKSGKEIIPGVSGRDFYNQALERYGRDSNYFKARVLGQIPDEDADALLQMAWIERAEKNRPIEHLFQETKRFLTVDVADGGNDEGVICCWENKHMKNIKILRDKQAEDYIAPVLTALKEIDGNAIIVDGDGIGRVLIRLLEAVAPKHVDIIAFKGSSKEVKDPTTFEYRYSEGHWLMRNDYEGGKISHPKDPILKEELCHVRIDPDNLKYLTIEKKKELKKEIGRSPDRKDAVMMMSAEYDRVKPIGTKDKWQWEAPVHDDVYTGF